MRWRPRDAWLSVSAAEGLARYTTRGDVIVPRLAAAAAADRPLALRRTARQSLGRFGEAGKTALSALPTEGLPSQTPARTRPAPRTAAADGRRVPRRSSSGGSSRPITAPGRRARNSPLPAATIELELYPGDAPLGLEYLIRVTESREIVGTEFSRVVPNFVAATARHPQRHRPARRGQPPRAHAWQSELGVRGSRHGKPGLHARHHPAAAQ